MEHADTGFVYVLTNDSMPGIVKIGETGQLAEDRAEDLHTTGVPEPFAVQFRALISRRNLVEKTAHKLLDQYRINPKREFFRVSPDKATSALRLAMLEKAGIAQWVGSERHILQKDDILALALEAGQLFARITYPTMDRLVSGDPVLDFWECRSTGDVLEIFTTHSATHVAGFSTDDLCGDTDPVPTLTRDGTVRNGILIGRERLLAGERLLWLPGPERASTQAPVLFEFGAFAQITARTWSLRVDSNGTPCLINILHHENIWPEAKTSIQKILALPPPRSWSPVDQRGEDWEIIGSAPLRPEDWLPQLKPRARRPRQR